MYERTFYYFHSVHHLAVRDLDSYHKYLPVASEWRSSRGNHCKSLSQEQRLTHSRHKFEEAKRHTAETPPVLLS
jgi:hypothetical protein